MGAAPDQEPDTRPRALLVAIGVRESVVGVSVGGMGAQMSFMNASVGFMDAPVKATRVSVGLTDAPVKATRVSVDLTDAPVKATRVSVAFMDTPVKATRASVGFMDTPLEAGGVRSLIWGGTHPTGVRRASAAGRPPPQRPAGSVNRASPRSRNEHPPPPGA